MSSDSRNVNEEIRSSISNANSKIHTDPALPKHPSILVTSPSKSMISELGCSYDEDDTVEVLELNDKNHEVYKTLQGYSLFKLKEKQSAIHNLLNMSNVAALFTSGDKNIIQKVTQLCNGPKEAMKSQKASTKTFPVNWSAQFCAQFITSFYLLMSEETEKRNETCERKRSLRNSPLPTAASHIIGMVNKAKSKVENDSRLRKDSRRKKREKAVKIS